MTLDELRGLVQQFYAPEELISFERAVVLYDKFQLEDYLDQLDIVIGNYYTKSETDAIDAIKATMLALSRGIVNRHGIQLDDDIRFSEVLDVLTVLSQLPDWSDRESLIDVCNYDMSAEMRFNELMSIILGRPVDEFLGLVESVDSSLLDRIKEDVQQEQEDEEDRMAAEEVLKYMHLREKLKAPSLWADRYMMVYGLAVTTFAVLLPLFVSDKAKLIDDAKSKEEFALLAEELIALASVSSEGIGKALELVETHQEELYRDPQRAMLLSGAMKAVFMEINRG